MIYERDPLRAVLERLDGKTVTLSSRWLARKCLRLAQYQAIPPSHVSAAGKRLMDLARNPPEGVAVAVLRESGPVIIQLRRL
jgi:hypothetical protein